MSDYTVGNFKNKADRDAQVKKMKEYIKLDRKLQERQAALNNAYYTNLSYGMSQPTSVPVTRSSRVEIDDIIKQKQDAMTNLRTIFPYGDDAQSALGYLSTDIITGTDVSEIALFNRHFTEFSKVIGSKNITPSYFNNVWDRWKVRLAKTQNTGLEIALDHTDLDDQLRQLSNTILYNLNQVVGLSNAKMDRIEKAIKVAVRERDENSLKRILQAVQDGNVAVLETLAREKVAEALTRRRADVAYEFETLNGMLKADLRSILADKLGVMNSDGFMLEYFDVKYISHITKARLIEEILKLQDKSYTPSKPVKKEEEFSPTGKQRGRPKKEPSADSGGAGAESGGAGDGTGGEWITPTKKGKPKGKGIKRKVIKGKGLVGIQPIKDPKFIDFGKYLIHIPSLKMNKLNMKYRSKGYISKSKEISDNLRELLFYVLENGKIDLDIYNKLDTDEKNYFNEISHKAQVETKLGIKYNEEDKRKQIQRFEVLRGQVLAGNNANEIFKELKDLLIQFVENGTITHKSGFDLIKDLGMI